MNTSGEHALGAPPQHKTAWRVWSLTYSVPHVAELYTGRQQGYQHCMVMVWSATSCVRLTNPVCASASSFAPALQTHACAAVATLPCADVPHWGKLL
jgi:hypothetical protein